MSPAEAVECLTLRRPSITLAVATPLTGRTRRPGPGQYVMLFMRGFSMPPTPTPNRRHR